MMTTTSRADRMSISRRSYLNLIGTILRAPPQVFTFVQSSSILYPSDFGKGGGAMIIADTERQGAW